MKFPDNLYYTSNDEWLRVDGDIGTMGITDFAQDQLSDIVFVEFMAEEGDMMSKGDTCAAVESVKAAADVYFPASGEVLEINEDLADSPELMNSDPYGDAWMVKVKLSDLSELEDLLNAAEYEAQAGEH